MASRNDPSPIGAGVPGGDRGRTAPSPADTTDPTSPPEMKERINRFDWAVTPLGPPETWSPTLKITLDIVLGARSPMAVYWGPDLLLLYNDAWREVIGDRHPGVLGLPARQALGSAWTSLRPLFERVQSGEGSAETQGEICLNTLPDGDGMRLDYTLNPIPSGEDAVNGILCIATEAAARVRAERVLGEVEREYSELVQRAPAAIYEIDFRHNRFTSVNDVMCRMLGYSRDELLDMDPSRLLDEEGRALFQRRMNQWLMGEEPDRNVQFRVKTAFGPTIDAVLDVTFTTDDQGAPVGATVVAHDVTEQNQRERRIRRYNRVVRAINRVFEQVMQARTEEALAETCLVVAMDVTGSEVGILGEVGPDGLLHDIAIGDTGWNRWAVIDQEGHRRPPGNLVLDGFCDQVVGEGHSLISNHPRAYPDGIEIPSAHPPLKNFLGVPLTHSGKTIGMLGVANREDGYGREQQEDLETLAPAVVEALFRRRVEEALKESEERLRLAAEAAGFGTYDADLVENRLYWSPQMKKILGLPADAPEPAPGTLPEFAHPDDAAHVRKLIETAYDPGGDGQVEDEHRVIRPDGSVRWVTVRGQVHFAGHGAERRPVRSTGVIRDVTARKRAEMELRGERELLQTIYDTIPVMLVTYDPRIEEVSYNKEFERVTGWSQEDTARTSIMELVYPDPTYREEAADYMASLVPGFRDMCMKAKDGRTIEASWANVRIPDGRQVGIGIDVSERKRSEKALRRYAERLHFLHQIDEAILGAASDDEVTAMVVNRIPRLLSCDRASVTLIDTEARVASLLAAAGHHGTELDAAWSGPIDAPWDDFLDAMRRGESQALDDLAELPGGSPFAEQLMSEGIRSQVYEPILIDGRLVGTLNVGKCKPGPLPHDERDVLRDLSTQLAVALEQARLREEVRRHTEELEDLVRLRTEALEASEARFRTIFEEAAIGIALIDPQARFIAANPALESMLGRAQEDLVSTPFFAALSGGTDGMAAAGFTTDQEGTTSLGALGELNTGARQEYSVELPFLRVGGELGEATVTVSPLRRDADQATPLLALVEDITERKQAQEALVRAERLTTMGRMAASLAHEVNNPLQSVVGCLGLAVEALAEGESATELMEVALQEVKRAARIVHRMRDLGREHGGEKEPSRITDLLDRVQTVTRKRAENGHVRVVREEGDHLPLVLMAPDHVQQVFLNLVLNAIDAMPEGGELRIQTRVTAVPPGVEVTFKDTGVGIPPQDLKHLFEAFHSDKEHGLGLGLYVSRNVVKDHGGRIDVKSKLGFGSTFTVWLPQALDDGPAGP